MLRSTDLVILVLPLMVEDISSRSLIRTLGWRTRRNLTESVARLDLSVHWKTHKVQDSRQAVVSLPATRILII